MKKRDKTEIIIILLEVGKNPISKTRMLYKSNTNTTTCKKYLDALMGAGFTEVDEDSNQYRTTEKGLEWLLRLKKSNEGLKKFNEYWK
jgi:predicted transcriptional regulator